MTNFLAQIFIFLKTETCLKVLFFGKKEHFKATNHIDIIQFIWKP